MDVDLILGRARPPSISNVYQIYQQNSQSSTQISERMQITEQQLANILTEKQNPLSLSAGCLDEKLAHLSPDIAGKQLALLENGEKHEQSQPGYANIPRVAVGSRKLSVYRSKGRKVTNPFSNIWSVSQRIQEQIVHSSGTRDRVEAESQIIVYPSKWLVNIGMAYGVKLSVLASRGWQYSFQPFRAVPESALIFEFCRTGNLDGVRTLLSRGDASPYDRDPSGKTPLWVRLPMLIRSIIINLFSMLFFIINWKYPHCCFWRVQTQRRWTGNVEGK